jgi:hypothetical protein
MMQQENKLNIIIILFVLLLLILLFRDRISTIDHHTSVTLLKWKRQKNILDKAVSADTITPDTWSKSPAGFHP